VTWCGWLVGKDGRWWKWCCPFGFRNKETDTPLPPPLIDTEAEANESMPKTERPCGLLAYLRHVGVLEALLERGEAELLRQLLLCGGVH